MGSNPRTPAWNDNFLACYPYLLDRIRGVQGVKKVLEATELQALTDSKRKLAPIDGGVYVIFSGMRPSASNNNGREQGFDISFGIILVKRNYTPQPNDTDDVGRTLTALCKALQGYEPEDEGGRALTLTPFEHSSPLPMRYEDGYAFFPLQLTTQVVVIADNDSN